VAQSGHGRSSLGLSVDNMPKTKVETCQGRDRNQLLWEKIEIDSQVRMQ
jgi:hypothetical protein